MYKLICMYICVYICIYINMGFKIKKIKKDFYVHKINIHIKHNWHP